jgi:hypothetical protein
VRPAPFLLPSAFASHYRSNRSLSLTWLCVICSYKILKLKNMDDSRCYIQLYKLLSLRPSNIFYSSVRHVWDSRFGFICCETCIILCDDLLPLPANLQGPRWGLFPSSNMSPYLWVRQQHRWWRVRWWERRVVPFYIYNVLATIYLSLSFMFIAVEP